MKIYNKDGEVIVDYPNAKTLGEALEKGVEDNVNFFGANLSGMKLQNLKLGGICLIGATCVGTDFSGTDFEGKMYRSNLSFTNFTGATMINTNLTWTNCEDADFSNTILKGAKFANANLYDAIDNGKEMVRIMTDMYTIVLTKDNVQIGCKGYTLEEWLSSDEDNDPLAWWQEWRPKLIKIIGKG